MLVCTLHVCFGGLLNDDQNLNWNKASIVLSKHTLTKLVPISKYGNSANLSLKLFVTYVLETLTSDL